MGFMNKTLSRLTSSAIVIWLVFGQGIIFAKGLSVDIDSDGLDISIGGTSIDIEDEDETSYRISSPSLLVRGSYANADIQGKDFSHRNLAGTHFTNADLTDVSFRGANLTNVIFLNATFINCVIRGAIVDGADFTNADFGGSKVSSVDFSRAIMTNVDIDNVNIIESSSLSSNNIEVILVKEDEPSSRVNLDIRFAHDSDQVEVHSIKQISDLSEALHSKKLKNKRVIIEGHTDSDGTNAYNLDLSQRRAESVINILVNNYGIAISRLTPKGFGENKPVYSNKTSFGKSVNRRVAVALAR
jgi:outer membrane protein OmpA-like peptidoglycan-associated protein